MVKLRKRRRVLVESVINSVYDRAAIYSGCHPFGRRLGDFVHTVSVGYKQREKASERFGSYLNSFVAIILIAASAYADWTTAPTHLKCHEKSP